MNYQSKSLIPVLWHINKRDQKIVEKASQYLDKALIQIQRIGASGCDFDQPGDEKKIGCLKNEQILKQFSEYECIPNDAASISTPSSLEREHEIETKGMEKQKFGHLINLTLRCMHNKSQLSMQLGRAINEFRSLRDQKIQINQVQQEVSDSKEKQTDDPRGCDAGRQNNQQINPTYIDKRLREQMRLMQDESAPKSDRAMHSVDESFEISLLQINNAESRVQFFRPSEVGAGRERASKISRSKICCLSCQENLVKKMSKSRTLTIRTYRKIVVVTYLEAAKQKRENKPTKISIMSLNDIVGQSDQAILYDTLNNQKPPNISRHSKSLKQLYAKKTLPDKALDEGNSSINNKTNQEPHNQNFNVPVMPQVSSSIQILPHIKAQLQPDTLKINMSEEKTKRQKQIYSQQNANTDMRTNYSQPKSTETKNAQHQIQDQSIPRNTGHSKEKSWDNMRFKVQLQPAGKDSSSQLYQQSPNQDSKHQYWAVKNQIIGFSKDKSKNTEYPQYKLIDQSFNQNQMLPVSQPANGFDKHQVSEQTQMQPSSSLDEDCNRSHGLIRLSNTCVGNLFQHNENKKENNLTSQSNFPTYISHLNNPST
eukprot:403355292